MTQSASNLPISQTANPPIRLTARQRDAVRLWTRIRNFYGEIPEVFIECCFCGIKNYCSLRNELWICDQCKAKRPMSL